MPKTITSDRKSPPQQKLSDASARTKLKKPASHHVARRAPSWTWFLPMLLLLLVGIGAAVGQHLLYAYINGREVDDIIFIQSWVIQFGSALAFLFKTALVAAVGIAFCHAFWFSVRRKTICVGTIDSIFGILRNPGNFFSKELFVKSIVLWILALVSWTLPVAAIFSPGALTGLHLKIVSNR